MKTEPTPLPEGPLSAEEMGQVLFQQRVAGASERQLAKFHNLSLRQVQDAIDAFCPRIDGAKRRRLLGVALERLDSLLGTFLPKAKAGDAQAAVVCIKLIERQAVLAGLEHPVVKEVFDVSSLPPQASSTEIIQAALDRIVNGGTPPQIEGRAEPPPAEGPERLH